MTDYQAYLRSPEWQAKRQEKLENCQHKWNAKADATERRHKVITCIIMKV